MENVAITCIKDKFNYRLCSCDSCKNQQKLEQEAIQKRIQEKENNK